MAVTGLSGTSTCLGDDGIDVLVRDGAASTTEYQLCSVAHHLEQVILAHSLIAVLHAPLLDDHGIQLQLLQRLLNHLQQQYSIVPAAKQGRGAMLACWQFSLSMRHSEQHQDTQEPDML